MKASPEKKTYKRSGIFSGLNPVYPVYEHHSKPGKDRGSHLATKCWLPWFFPVVDRNTSVLDNEDDEQESDDTYYDFE